MMRKDMINDMAELLEQAGAKMIKTQDAGSFPGMGIHEMGTARMGRDAKARCSMLTIRCGMPPMCFCHRRLVHGFKRLSKPLAYLYGTYRPGGAPCGG